MPKTKKALTEGKTKTTVKKMKTKKRPSSPPPAPKLSKSDIAKESISIALKNIIDKEYSLQDSEVKHLVNNQLIDALTIIKECSIITDYEVIVRQNLRALNISIFYQTSGKTFHRLQCEIK